VLGRGYGTSLCLIVLTPKDEAAAGELGLLYAGVDGIVRSGLPGYRVPEHRLKLGKVSNVVFSHSGSKSRGLLGSVGTAQPRKA
jgi:hypothetical protein